MTTRLQRDFGTATNNKIFTVSVWIKKNKIGNTHTILCGSGSSHARPTPEFILGSLGQISFFSYNGSDYDIQLDSNAKYRDINGWYHLVMAVDTTQATASNRIKFYMNGEQVTSLNNTTYPSQNLVCGMNNNVPHCIGGSTFGSYGGGNNDCIMSHFHFIDGIAYTPSAFGETDATTGEWKIKTSPSVTYGNNGFFILKDGNSVTDQSGNGNNWSVGGGTLTKTEDCPSNVFATLNALDNYYFNGTFSNGNNTVASNASVESYWTSSLGASSGKYYWEVKISSSGSGRDFVGIADKSSTTSAFSAYSGNSKMRSYYGYTGVSVVGSTGSSFGDTFGTGDIIGVAMDLDNYKLYFSKNGAWQNSQNPSTGTNGLDIDTSPASGFYYAQGANIHNTASTFQTNFGNGFFGTTAVSSAGTNASGIGIFEYDVPTGYSALSTKGLNL